MFCDAMEVLLFKKKATYSLHPEKNAIMGSVPVKVA
jgi:hypothetical protein